MAIKLSSNLHRNRFGILYFRLTIPKDLQKHFETKAIYRSLHTANVRLAVDAAQSLALPLRRLFKEIRQQTMTDTTTPPKFDLNAFEKMPDIRQRLKIAGLENSIKESDALITQQEYLIANLDVSLSEKTKQHREDIAAIYNSRMPAMASAPTPPASSALLSSYIDKYVASINANREGWDLIGAQGVSDHLTSAKILVEIVGDKPLHELTVRDRNRFDEVIKRYPVNRTKKPIIKDLVLADILELSEYAKLSLNTAKYHGRRATQFLKWVFRQEGLDVPFVLLEEVKLKKSKGSEKLRREFNEDELRILFDAKTYPWSDHSPKKLLYKFWIPLIGLHTGARINEIAQLRISDIVLVDGIACFNISDLPDPKELKSSKEYIGKTVKTYAAKRVVPIHSRLIGLGFLEYVEAMKGRGARMVFEDLSHAKTKYGSLVSKWFANYCDSVGLTDKSLTFHGFRHGAVSSMRRAGIAKDLRMIVVGHSATQDTHDDYGDIYNDVTIRGKQKAIESLGFSDWLDFNALKEKAAQCNVLAMQPKLKNTALTDLTEPNIS